MRYTWWKNGKKETTKGKEIMNIYIENEYDKEMKERLDYEKLIEEVVNEAVDYVKCPYECEVNVTIVTNERIHEINNEFRGIDKETDVLSFPMIDYDKPGDFTGFDEIDDYFDLDTGELILGDIVISYDRVISQAHEFNHSVRREFAFLVAHSMLHLFGYDHMEEDDKAIMRKREEELLGELKISR